EQWRDGSGGVNTLAFSYATGAAGATDILNGTFTAATALNFSSPQNSGLATDIALDGNAAANRTAKNATISGISWAPGQALVLKWQDTNDAGNDDGLAVDDLTFSGGFAGKNLVWNTPNGTWNTTQSNWLDGANPSTFS